MRRPLPSDDLREKIANVEHLRREFEDQGIPDDVVERRISEAHQFVEDFPDIAADPRLLARAAQMDLSLEIAWQQSKGASGMPFGSARFDAIGHAIRKEIGSRLDNTEPPSDEETSETIEAMAQARLQGLHGIEAHAALGQRPVRDPVSELPPLPPIPTPPKRMRTIHSAIYGKREVEADDEELTRP